MGYSFENANYVVVNVTVLILAIIGAARLIRADLAALREKEKRSRRRTGRSRRHS